MAGFVWAVYSSDDGYDYLLKVDNDLFGMTERGWDYPIEGSYLPQYPRGWKPRYVIGLSPAGERRDAICANTSSMLWTGAITDFVYRDTNGGLVTAQVIMRVAENRVK